MKGLLLLLLSCHHTTKIQKKGSLLMTASQIKNEAFGQPDLTVKAFLWRYKDNKKAHKCGLSSFNNLTKIRT